MSMLATRIAEAISEARQKFAAQKPWDNAVLAPSTAWLLADDLERLLFRQRRANVVKVNEYMGIKILEDRNMPTNRMVLRLGDKVVAIVDLDRAPLHDHQEG
jgi:hypothetical protein